MRYFNALRYVWGLGLCLWVTACGIPKVSQNGKLMEAPGSYSVATDSVSAGELDWRTFFADPYLVALIDSALEHNQELRMVLQEIEVARSEVRIRKGEYLPFVDVGGGAGVDKPGRYTRAGATEANLELEPGREFPEPLPDVVVAASASWELDVWRKLRNARQAAVHRYLAEVEGRRFMQTELVAEIAEAYYELIALDQQLEILRDNLRLQQSALDAVRMQQQAARVTGLAVKKFEAELYKNQGLQYEILQRIKVAENRINFLVGRFPQPVERNTDRFGEGFLPEVAAGMPRDLLANRPDIRAAEQVLAARKLDVQVARAQFFPSVRLTAAMGVQAFSPKVLLAPESLLFSLAGDLVAPLVNRNAIKAGFQAANARQLQAVEAYGQTLLGAYLEVENQLSLVDNLAQGYRLRSRELEVLNQSVGIAGNLFRSAKADYMEVLHTQRDALSSRMELAEWQQRQWAARIGLYRMLGGGWE